MTRCSNMPASLPQVLLEAYLTSRQQVPRKAPSELAVTWERLAGPSDFVAQTPAGRVTNAAASPNVTNNPPVSNKPRPGPTQSPAGQAGLCKSGSDRWLR